MNNLGRPIPESWDIIKKEILRQAKYESRESSILRNAAFMQVQQIKIKRGPNLFLPVEGEQPITTIGLTQRQLHHFADIMLRRSQFMQDVVHYSEQGRPVPKASTEYKARQSAVLKETEVDPLEIAYLFGFTSDRAVRALRHRHGLDEVSGFPLRDEQRPIVSPNRKRQRKVRGKR